MAKKIESAEILCVGTELLLGDVVNTNAAYIARKLAMLGISVYHQSVVGDNPKRLREALADSFSRADLVILSGGLGPTYDDLTKETVAAYFGRKLVRDESVLGEIERYFVARYGPLSQMTPNNRKQADIPEGGRALHNPNGTAPGILIEGDDKTAILLPGPPRELEPMMDDQVVPYLAERSGRVFVSRTVHLAEIGESAIEDALYDLMQSTNPTLAPYAKEGEVQLRVTASAHTREEALSLCDGMIGKVYASSVAEYIYGLDVGTIQAALVSALAEKHLTVAVAESCTGGLIASRITDVSGASAVFLGGLVTYTEGAKESLLGVRRESLERFSAVSEQVAREMAEGTRERLGADIGISTTGYAGPTGGTEKDPVGTVYIGVATKEGTKVTRLSLSSLRSRSYVRTVATGRALLYALRTTQNRKK